MIEKINLPYSMDSLEPYYDAKTLDIHYNILYEGYVSNTNKVLEKLRLARDNNDYSSIKCLEKDLSFYGSGVILHKLFFENLTPNKNTYLSQNLLFQINKDFGSLEKFKMQFSESAKAVEASGWGILVWNREFRKLEIIQCEKHQNLTLWNSDVLLVLDMWEHSYFLQYGANRSEYINAFWNIINLDIVSKRFGKIL